MSALQTKKPWVSYRFQIKYLVHGKFTFEFVVLDLELICGPTSTSVHVISDKMKMNVLWAAGIIEAVRGQVDFRFISKVGRQY